MAQPQKTHREAILRTGTDLLASHGLKGLSIRSVANALHLAPNAIYYYFDSLESLQNAVASRVCAMLHSGLGDACEGQPPARAVRALAHTYLTFAKEQHYLYEALLLPRPVDSEDALAPELLWLFVVSQVSRVSGAKDAPQAAVALWAALHGLASLQSVEAFNEEKPTASIDFAVDAWLAAARVKFHKANAKTKKKARIKGVA